MNFAPEEVDLITLLVAFLIDLLFMAILVFVLVMAIVHYRWFPWTWKRGLLVGLVLAVVSVPGVALGLYVIDMDQVMREFGGSHEFPIPGLVHGLVIGFVIVVHLLLVGWRLLEYHAAFALWSRLRPYPMPLLSGRGEVPWRWLLGGAGLGVAAGVVSVAVFHWVEVEQGPLLRGIEHMMRGLEDVPPVLRIPAALTAVTVPAITEELVFRGVLLGGLLYLARGHGVAVAASIVLVAALWALVHFGNTNMPLMKMGQIFLVGLVLGELARRACLEAAMAGHVGLNVTAVLAEVVAQG